MCLGFPPLSFVFPQHTGQPLQSGVPVSLFSNSNPPVPPKLPRDNVYITSSHHACSTAAVCILISQFPEADSVSMFCSVSLEQNRAWTIECSQIVVKLMNIINEYPMRSGSSVSRPVYERVSAQTRKQRKWVAPKRGITTALSQSLPTPGYSLEKGLLTVRHFKLSLNVFF